MWRKKGLQWWEIEKWGRIYEHRKPFLLNIIKPKLCFILYENCFNKCVIFIRILEETMLLLSSIWTWYWTSLIISLHFNLLDQDICGSTCCNLGNYVAIQLDRLSFVSITFYYVGICFLVHPKWNINKNYNWKFDVYELHFCLYFSLKEIHVLLFFFREHV